MADGPGQTETSFNCPVSGHCRRKSKDSGLGGGVAGNADFYLLCQGFCQSDLKITHAQSNRVYSAWDVC